MTRPEKRGDGVQQTDAARVLARGPWFRSFPAAVQAEVLEAIQIKSYPAGQDVFRQGDAPRGLYAVISGLMHTVGHAANGNRRLMAVVRPGDWSGILSALDGRAHVFSSTTKIPCEVALLPNAAIERIFFRSADRLKLLMSPKMSVVRHLYHYVVELEGQSPEVKLAQRLIDFSRWAYLQDSEVDLDVELVSQDDMASATMLSRPTVNRILKTFEERKIVELGYNRIRILDEEALRHIARG